MKCIVIDDDPVFLDLMGYFISKQPSLDLVRSFSSGVEAAKAMSTLQVDLVFLDIQMPGATGMELVKDLRKDSQVIFVTAHEEFAVEAFSHQVTDYLVKPINETRFSEAVARANEIHKQKSIASEQQEIFVKINNRFQKVLCKEILSVDADGDYVNIRTRNATHLVATSLNAMEKLLNSHCFMRVHRKNIVRIGAIQYIDQNEAILHDKSRVSISRSKKPELLGRLQNH